jgi:uncharacterized protein (TIGR00299 family) protein
MSGTKILFLESVAGVAGDMFTASFLDAGLVTAEDIRALPSKLGLKDVEIIVSTVNKAMMKATHVDVRWKTENWKTAFAKSGTHAHTHFRLDNEKNHTHINLQVEGHEGHWHTHYSELDQFLAQSALDAPIKEFARKVFRLIGEAEADAHGISIDEVAFHEVGTVDSILDVVMAALCLEKVKPAKILATPVKLGRGTVNIAHGTHPVPPPACIRLATGMPMSEVPAAITRENVELSTPTGLAILKALEPEFTRQMPSGTIRAQGMGAGTMDLGVYPNVFRVSVLEAQEVITLPYETDEVVEISCNLDDETAERTAWLMDSLLEKGALDTWVAPITGKKGRSSVCLSVLCSEEKFRDVADWILRQSTTFGLRYQKWDRLKLARRFETAKTAQGSVRVKIGSTTTGEVLKSKPEFEDLKKIWECNPSFKI